jgi:hemolysin activation/secretion protein
LRWLQGDRFTARLDWGIPLVSVDSQNGTWQENGLYFSLLYNHF